MSVVPDAVYFAIIIKLRRKFPNIDVRLFIVLFILHLETTLDSNEHFFQRISFLSNKQLKIQLITQMHVAKVSVAKFYLRRYFLLHYYSPNSSEKMFIWVKTIWRLHRCIIQLKFLFHFHKCTVLILNKILIAHLPYENDLTFMK